MADAFIVGGVRTPIGRYGGALATVRPDDLAALVVRELVARTGVPADQVDDVILGDANQAGEDNRNVARMAALLAGLPVTVPGITVNRLCASGLSAVHLAAAMVRSGEADVVIAGGVESMTRAPWVMAKPERAFGKPGAVFDTSIGWRFVNPALQARDGFTLSMPETGEEVGRREGISRDDADAFALRSHQRALRAVAAGHFDDELVAVETPTGLVKVDEGPRADTSLEALARLRPVVAGGTLVTAGNASPLNDGAAAVLVASEAAVERFGLTPRARVLGGASAGVSPRSWDSDPCLPSRKLLERTGMALDDFEAVELNEAFATQALAVIRRLGLDEEHRQRGRRRHRPRPPARRLRHPHPRHAARPHGPRGRRPRPGHDVRRRRAGRGARRGARPMSTIRTDTSRADRVHVTLARPEVKNAINAEMVAELHDLCADLERDPRILILGGSDGVFASGADIAELRDRRAPRCARGRQLRALRADRRAAHAGDRGDRRVGAGRRGRARVRR